ncbi:hypothetical protein [Siminovitchia fortis]|nr:hypothetical protein [Siminovitchia fortis]
MIEKKSFKKALPEQVKGDILLIAVQTGCNRKKFFKKTVDT